MISLASLGSIVKGGLSLGHFGAQPFGRLSDGKREGGILLRAAGKPVGYRFAIVCRF
jgi:hypothetical protein